MIASDLNAMLGWEEPVLPVLESLQNGTELFIVDALVKLAPRQCMQVISAQVPLIIVTLHRQNHLNGKC